MARIRLCKIVFDHFLEALQRTYERACFSKGYQVPASRSQAYYGFTTNKQGYSLHDALQDHPLVQSLLAENKIKLRTAKYLYNLERSFTDLNRPYDSVEVDQHYLDIYAVFLNPVSYHPDTRGNVQPHLLGDPQQLLAEFQERHRSASPTRPHTIETYFSFADYVRQATPLSDMDRKVQLLFLDNRRRHELCEEFKTSYTAHYYYYRDNRIQRMEIDVDFINASAGQYPVRVRGLHREGELPADRYDYTGFGEQTRACFFANLRQPAIGNPLSLILYTSHQRAEDLMIMHGSLQGISSEGHPTASELTLVKTRSYGKAVPTPGDHDLIHYYHFMQRRYFRVPPRIYSHLDQLIARKIPSVEIREMQGYYRIWNLIDKKGEVCIVQSCFSITSERGAQLKTQGPGIRQREQVVMMSISQLQTNKLCLSTHPKNGVSVINYAIMDVPKPGRAMCQRGVYCLNQQDKLGASSFVFCSEDGPMPSTVLNARKLRVLFGKSSPERQQLYHMMLNDLRDLNSAQRELHEKSDTFLSSLLRDLSPPHAASDTPKSPPLY